jgi:hypothetical protein
MSEYLSKEEIRKWRSSLERITLEEYAARLGKVIQEEKHDDSLVDSVIFRSLTSMSTDKYIPRTEKIQTLAIKSFNKEKEVKENKEIKETKQVKDIKEVNKIKEQKIEKEKVEKKQPEQKQKEVKQIVEEVVVEKKKEAPKSKEKAVKKVQETEFSFKKALTTREQLVFDHFFANRNTIVYAKDLAKILELPRDYVYKYIKNLRSKLNEDILQNADNGGYLLKV